MARGGARLALLALIVVLPEAASACAVCFSTTEENRWAFIATTLFLSVAPLAILFAVGSWLRGKVMAEEARHEAVRQAARSPERSA